MKKGILLFLLIAGFINCNASDTLDIKKWKKYYFKDANLTISYPDFLLKLDSTNDQMALCHFIPFKHPDRCNLKDSVVDSVLAISDLCFSIQYLKINFKELLGDYGLKNYLVGDTLRIEPGIDKANAGILKGYKIEMGGEGCGRIQFIFPLKDKSTLLITMYIAPDENINSLNQSFDRDYALVKGLMSPQLSGKIFYKIIESIH